MGGGMGILPAMRGVTLYIMRQIAWPLVFATLTLTGVIWLTQALRFIDRIVNNNLAFLDFLYLTMLVLPSMHLAVIGALVYAAFAAHWVWRGRRAAS